MITMFNRKELLETMDMKRESDVLEILSRNGIEYTFEVKNLQTSGFRCRVGNYGINNVHSYSYKIYVRKKDYDKARYLIQ